MVPVVDDVVAELLGANGGVAQGAVVAMLGVELGGDPDRAHRVLQVAWVQAIVNLHLGGRSSATSCVFTIGRFARLAGVSPKVLRDV